MIARKLHWYLVGNCFAVHQTVTHKELSCSKLLRNIAEKILKARLVQASKRVLMELGWAVFWKHEDYVATHGQQGEFPVLHKLKTQLSLCYLLLWGSKDF